MPDAAQTLAQCSGNAQSKVFVCFPDDENVPDQLLEKILAAVNLKFPEDLLILRKTPNEPFSFSALMSRVQLEKILVFGLAPQQLGLQIIVHNYQPFQLNNCTFLFADDLKIIAADKLLKVRLWEALKHIFQ